ncbi:MAG: TIGR02680 family protein [Herminiimonas sp.]|nr:TIGR02680 family protein [Herminiimonas sp.]
MITPDKPALPTPGRARWQPLRLGLVELFHYDSEEFWFRDGHLLLRGNNGTGKSKVLSLTLPFLFDAQLKSSRIEPDGDPGKKMAWNLLMGRHDRRIGYAWIEFGRVSESGAAEYLTLGCGLSAATARPQVDSWFFVLEDQRIGEHLWLTSPQRVVLTRERLREALEGTGQVFDTATAYRRAVDERLFHLGPARYAALIDTLIQLRQPQLSKKPDEVSLSNALTEALPPMSADLLTDVADALNQLEEYRRELEEYEALERAVGQFNQRYRIYASTQARRQARSLRSAQTGFDGASRTLNEGRGALASAQAAEVLAQTTHGDAELELAANRTRLEQLQDDPAMRDAKRLELADRDAQTRQSEAEQAQRTREETQARLERECQGTRERSQRAATAAQALAEGRSIAQHCAERASIAGACESNPLIMLDAAGLTALNPLSMETARKDLLHSVATRREQLALMQSRCDHVDQAEQAHARQQNAHDERQYEADEAAARRAEADLRVEQQGHAELSAWQTHFDGLQQLRIEAAPPVLDALAAWVVNLDGDNPARHALQLAQQATSERLARHEAALLADRGTLEEEQAKLNAERAGFEQGVDAAPPAPLYRAPEARRDRSGAPLWQLVEFREGVDEFQRAGLEAALQAAGLLDAWITPDGAMHTIDKNGKPLHDTDWLERPRQSHSLAHWLLPGKPASQSAAPVPAATLQRLLEGVASGSADDGMAEAWVSVEGRFRLGALGGFWSKPAADYIGFAARAAARARRLEEIALRLNDIANQLASLALHVNHYTRDQHQAASEWHTAPNDDALRAAHVEAVFCAHTFQTARSRLAQADQQLQASGQQLQAARQALANDATDLRLPDTRPALQEIVQALQQFSESLHAMFQAVRELRDSCLELAHQQLREQEAHADTEQAAQTWVDRYALAEEARIRLETLRESVGAQVEELQQRLADARSRVKHGEDAVKSCGNALRLAGEERARAGQKTADAETTLKEKTAARQSAVSHLQGFAATGLLASAMPEADIPDLRTPWTIEPALTLARRAEQTLASVKDDDEAWSRVQSQISQDYSELGRALAALSHQAQAETNDYGLVVTIVYQNRPERPDQLSARLAGEIAQRRELLTAGERKVLENHLQAEIAAAVQKLLQDAERQVSAINAELEKRPTSTGVRFRLQWQPLPEGVEGAPIGLEAARKRLLNTSTDLWSAEDRRVVGEMLHQRIGIERSRADSAGGGSLLDQLARALDYRRWHRFRVQRWQDGQWRPLSGPASSGERALGLTVPLFAAVSSYYTQSGYAHAPRLVLLDEAFAGIDDAARAHCMGLIHEFDLDFVITSEREWACYAELPGVAICQLQRREGVDAVHVSRWTWNGRARRVERDPDRRFQPIDSMAQQPDGAATSSDEH